MDLHKSFKYFEEDPLLHESAIDFLIQQYKYFSGNDFTLATRVFDYQSFVEAHLSSIMSFDFETHGPMLVKEYRLDKWPYNLFDHGKVLAFVSTTKKFASISRKKNKPSGICISPWISLSGKMSCGILPVACRNINATTIRYWWNRFNSFSGENKKFKQLPNFNNSLVDDNPSSFVVERNYWTFSTSKIPTENTIIYRTPGISLQEAVSYALYIMIDDDSLDCEDAAKTLSMMKFAPVRMEEDTENEKEEVCEDDDEQEEQEMDSIEEEPEHKCEYKFVRGKNVGSKCGKYCGSVGFCTDHMKRKSVIKILNERRRKNAV